MCTVTYIPGKENEFIFTSNRDETPKRSVIDLAEKKLSDKQIFFPKDPLAGGSWIIMSDTGQLVCILNGAYQKHKHRPPYRLSRGIMALDFFNYKSFESFYENFNFEGMEPFTMIIIDKGKLFEVRRGEEKTYLTEKDQSLPHIWASATLYPDEWIEKRKIWFSDWQNQNEIFDQKNILNFHRSAGEGNPEYDLVMNRKNIVRTVSITSVYKGKEKMSMRHEDVLTGQTEKKSMKLKHLESIPK